MELILIAVLFFTPFAHADEPFDPQTLQGLPIQKVESCNNNTYWCFWVSKDSTKYVVAIDGYDKAQFVFVVTETKEKKSKFNLVWAREQI